MKEKIFFKVIEYIDDELISEAAEYRPDMDGGVILNEDEAYGVSTNVVRTRRLWKYPVTVMALLGIVGGAVFIINYSGIIIDNVGAATDTEDTELTVNAGNNEVSTVTEKTVEETISTIVSKEPDPIVPIKTKELITAGCIFYVESFPDIPKIPFGQECFTEMSSDELFKYYGIEDIIDNLVSYMSHDNKAHGRDYLEVVDNNPYGIYTSPDGDTFDVNSFHFSNPNFGQNDITITVGKKIRFGQEYYIEYIPEGQKYHMWSLFYYNKDKDILFAVYEYNGCSVMITSVPEDYENILENYDNFSIEERKEFVVEAAGDVFSQILRNMNLLDYNGK